MTTNQIRLVRMLMSKKGIIADKEAIVLQYTNQRTTHLSEMTWQETKALIEMLQGKDSRERMTNKMLSMCHVIGWEVVPGGAVDMARLNAWLVKYSPAHKPLKELSSKELQQAVGIFEKVYENALKNL